VQERQQVHHFVQSQVLHQPEVLLGGRRHEPRHAVHARQPPQLCPSAGCLTPPVVRNRPRVNGVTLLWGLLWGLQRVCYTHPQLCPSPRGRASVSVSGDERRATSRTAKGAVHLGAVHQPALIQRQIHQHVEARAQRGLLFLRQLLHLGVSGRQAFLLLATLLVGGVPPAQPVPEKLARLLVFRDGRFDCRQRRGRFPLLLNLRPRSRIRSRGHRSREGAGVHTGVSLRLHEASPN
jgi:hypothetical protein